MHTEARLTPVKRPFRLTDGSSRQRSDERSLGPLSESERLPARKVS